MSFGPASAKTAKQSTAKGAKRAKVRNAGNKRAAAAVGGGPPANGRRLTQAGSGPGTNARLIA